jgi:hypothetical protein
MLVVDDDPSDESLGYFRCPCPGWARRPSAVVLPGGEVFAWRFIRVRRG